MHKYLANTVFTGKKLLHLPSCHSTNTVVRELAQEIDLPDGSIVITDHQTSGKGQRGNVWESAPEENLTFSVFYKPTFLNSDESFFLNIITSLALVKTLTTFGIPVLIKWPNDIYCSTKKISGILIENSIDRNQIKNSVIGIGLNVNQAQFSHSQATSMYFISNRQYKLPSIFENAVTHLEQMYLKLKSGNKAFLLEEYHKNLLGRNESRTFIVNDHKVSGVILGIDKTGRLKVEIAGKTEYFSFKEISFLF